MTNNCADGLDTQVEVASRLAYNFCGHFCFSFSYNNVLRLSGIGFSRNYTKCIFSYCVQVNLVVNLHDSFLELRETCVTVLLIPSFIDYLPHSIARLIKRLQVDQILMASETLLQVFSILL